MTATKFTPGPWRHAVSINLSNVVEANTGRAPLYANDDCYDVVASVQPCTASYKRDDKDENCAANIALIAAAPDLYAALEAAAWFVRNFPQSHIPENHGFVLPIEHVDAVLRKARGE